MNKRLSTLIDVSRWSCAWLVVLWHARELSLAPYASLKSKPVWVKTVYFMSSFGREAVMVFFVLSGLLVGGLTLTRLSRGFRGGDYAAHRLSRIYTVIIPALLLTALLDLVGPRIASEHSLYEHYLYAGRSAPTVFVGNLLQLQGILVPTFGSNNPLWSLSYECWYYVLFALGVGVAQSRGAGRGIYGFLAAALLVVLPAEISSRFLIWLLGAATWLWIASDRLRPPAALAVIAFIAGLAVSKALSGGAPEIGGMSARALIRDASCALGFCVLLRSLSTGNMRENVLVAINRNLAAFSFSTYAFHFPIMVFLVSLLSPLGYPLKAQPSATAVGELFVLCAIGIGCTWIAWAMFERHTPRVKRLLGTFFEG